MRVTVHEATLEDHLTIQPAQLVRHLEDKVRGIWRYSRLDILHFYGYKEQVLAIFVFLYVEILSDLTNFCYNKYNKLSRLYLLLL